MTGLLLLGALVALVWLVVRAARRAQAPASAPDPAADVAAELVTSAPDPAADVAAELVTLLDRSDVLVVDVETTGFGKRAEVLAVAVIDTTGRVLLDTVSLPQGPIPRDASAVHGLTRDRLRSMGARPWPEVHADVAALVGAAAAVLAWNADYDRRLLAQTAERHGLTLPAATWRCAMKAEALTRGTSGEHAQFAKLGAAAARLNVPELKAHNALQDVRTTLAVLRALVGG